MRRIWENRLFWEWLGVLCLLMTFAHNLRLQLLLPVHIPCDIKKYGKICEVATSKLPLFGGPWFWKPYATVVGILLYIWLLAMWFYGRKVLMKEKGAGDE